MTRVQSADPKDRMGIYKRLDDVPNERRLEQFREQYQGMDTYRTFLTEHLFERYELSIRA